MNISQDTLERYQAAGVSIFDPQSFDVREEINIISSIADEKVIFRALDDPSAKLSFENVVTWVETNYGINNISYCEVTAESDGRAEILYGVDDNRRMIGSLHNISNFMNDRFSDGFVNQDDYDRNADKLEQTELEADDSDAMYADDLRVFDEYPIPTAEEFRKEMEVKKADVPGNMEKLTAFDFSGFDSGTYSGAFGCGYIPYEFRIGYDGNTDADAQTLTKEDIDFIRENYDPDFGYILGVDTTTYDDSPSGNIEIVDMSYDTVKPFIMGMDYPEDRVEYIRAYRETGEGFHVDEKEFHVVNLVTIDIKVKDIDMPFRHTEVIDDAGISRGHLELRGYSGILDLNTPGKHFPELDRFSGLDKEEKDSLLSKVESQIPDFFRDFTDRMDQRIDERRPLQETRMEKFSQDREAIRNVFNRVELYREIQAAKIAKAEYRLDNTLSRIKKVYEPMTGKVPGSVEYKELNKKFEALKNNLIKDYHAYMKISHELEPETLNDIVRSVRANYDKAMDRYNDQKQTIEAFFEQVFVDDTGYRHRDSYRESVIDNKHIDNPVTHFEHLCATLSLKHDGFPVDSHGAEIVSQYDDAMEQIDNGIKEVVEKFNSTATELEKVHIDSETGQVYTSTGFKVEPSLTPRMTVEDRFHLPIDKIDLEDKFNANMISEDMKNVPYDVQPMTIGPTDQYERMSIREYAQSKAPGEKFTRGEYDKNFIKQAIYGRAPENAVDNVGRKSADTKKNAIIDRFGAKERQEIGDICRTVDKYVDRNAPSKSDVYRDIRIEAQINKDQERETDKGTDKDNNKDMEKDATDSENMEKDATDSDEYDSAFESREGQYERKQSLPYGKTDNSKDVQISPEKMKEFREEAKKEANGDTVKEERLYQKKCGELAERLAEIKKDIIHYDKQMSKFDDIPFKWKGQHTYYQAAKLEYDSAIREYQNLGGRVGEGQFVEKGVSKLEALAGRFDVYNTNLLNTIGFEKLAGRGGAWTFKDIYRDGSDRVDSYSKFNNITKAFNLGFGYTFGEITRMAVDGADKALKFFSSHEKVDNDKDNDTDKNAGKEDVSEDSDTAEKDINNDDVEKEMPDDADKANDTEENGVDTVDDSKDDAVSDEKETKDTTHDGIEKDQGDFPDVFENHDDSADEKSHISNDAEEENRTDIQEDKPKDIDRQDMPENDIQHDDSWKEDNENLSDKTEKSDVAAEISQETERPEDIDRDDADRDDMNADKDSQDATVDKDTDEPLRDDSQDKEEEVDESEKDMETDEPDADDTDKVREEVSDDSDVQDRQEDNMNDSSENIEGTQSVDINDESNDDIDEGDILTPKENHQSELSKKEGEEASVDAASLQSDGIDEGTAKEELTQAMENVLTEKDDMESLLGRLSEVIADDSLSIADISDALFDAIVNSTQGDEAVPSGTENLLYEFSNALDGSPLENLTALLSDFEEKGMDSNLVRELENNVAYTFEDADDFEVNMAPQYDNLSFEADGVFDMSSGMNADIATDFLGLEDVMQGHMDVMDYGVDADIPLFEQNSPDIIEVNGIDRNIDDSGLKDVGFDDFDNSRFGMEDNYMFNDSDNGLSSNMDTKNLLDMIPDTTLPDTYDIESSPDTDNPEDFEYYSSDDVSSGFSD